MRFTTPTSSLFFAVAPILSSIFALPLDSRQAYSTNGTVVPPSAIATSISFGECPKEIELPLPLECASYSVPVDWDEPEGAHFDLGLVRLPAPANSTTKIGSLFINPGGPGGVASRLVAQIAAGFFPLPDGLIDAFDLIGLDPRGVGLSHAVECDQSIWAERVSWFPQTEEEYEKLVDKNKRYGQSCREKTGPLLEYLDTLSVAKVS
jgi:hypothetical protein